VGRRNNRAHQWSRTAWALALLFASLPIASKLFVGGWAFSGAAELALLCALLGTYFHFVSRRNIALRDAAAMLDEALELARGGETEKSIDVLTKTIRFNPRLWQAYQYRAELWLLRDAPEKAIEDLTIAIRLAPDEGHLHKLLERAQQLG
jgi:tetratricopeptide (TPR) repeat protein